MNKVDQYSLIKVSNKKWLENENDLEDDEYELPILKYDANQDTLVEQKEETLEQEEEELRTPSQLAYEEGKDLKSKVEKSFGLCSEITVDSWH